MSELSDLRRKVKKQVKVIAGLKEALLLAFDWIPLSPERDEDKKKLKRIYALERKANEQI